MWVMILLKNIFVTSNDLIIISFKNLSMIFNERYQRLLTSIKSIRNPNTIRLSTLEVVRHLLNQTWLYLGTSNRWNVTLSIWI